MQTEYKGYTITYDENHEHFRTTIGASDLSATKLKDLKLRIDKFEKKEKKFKRINILAPLRWNRRDDLRKGQITSIADNFGIKHNPDVWVVVEGERSKRSLGSNIYLDNKNNQRLYTEIRKLMQQMNAINSRIDSLYKEMERPTITEDK